MTEKNYRLSILNRLYLSSTLLSTLSFYVVVFNLTIYNYIYIYRERERAREREWERERERERENKTVIRKIYLIYLFNILSADYYSDL